MSPKISSDVKARYAKDAARYRPKPPYLRNFLAAFGVGGGISLLGQVIHRLFLTQGLNAPEAGARMAVTVIFLGALLTGIGLYDRLGKFGGAGSAIPISGFANAIVSPAIEFSREGYVLGMASQLFMIAGPVIVYGVSAAVVMAAVRALVFGGG